MSLPETARVNRAPVHCAGDSSADCGYARQGAIRMSGDRFFSQERSHERRRGPWESRRQRRAIAAKIISAEAALVFEIDCRVVESNPVDLQIAVKAVRGCAVSGTGS